MPEILISPFAEDDLDRLWHPNTEDIAALLDTIFEDLISDEIVARYLHADRHTHPGFDPIFESERIGEFWKRGYLIFKMKFFDPVLSNYRVMYGYNPKRDIFHVLSITERRHAYDPNNDHSKELFFRYESVGIPRHN